jgi:SAM-dependent methyltransferase
MNMDASVKQIPGLTPPRREDGERLRAFFRESNYNREVLREEMGFTDQASFRYQTHLLSTKTELTAIEALSRWFTCGLSIPARHARESIPAWAIELCEACGLLVAEGDDLSPTVMLSPFEELLIASDPISRLEGDASDLILWPNATTFQIMHGTIRRSVESALDLGCATGALALAAASHSVRVVATDLNARAREFTRFNAELNGVQNIECLIGNRFEPVANLKFDQIVCNPPFFLTPSTGLMYCENPMELDSFARQLVREAPAHLNESGFFQMLCEWVEIEGEPWRDRLQEWFEGLGCDALVLNTYTMHPMTYGKQRCDQRPGSRAQAETAFAEWVDFHKRRKVQTIHGGLITLRRRSARNWTYVHEDVPLLGPIADFILERFRVRDLVESDHESLLASKLQIVPNARLRQRLRQDGQKWVQSGLALTLPGPPERELELAPLVADFAGKFDGTRTLNELIVELAQATGADIEKVTSECLGIIRTMLDRGYLC